MPSSRPHSIPFVVSIIRQIQPSTVLEIGCGFGKYGYLVREYTDIVASELDSERYHKRNWKVRIDAIEVYQEYITDAHRYIYNNIYIGNASDLLENVDKYDIIMICDVIEHFEKQEGMRMINKAIEKSNIGIIITTPAMPTNQKELCDNVFETHRSHWEKRDFRNYNCLMKVIHPGNILTIYIHNKGVISKNVKNVFSLIYHKYCILREIYNCWKNI